MEPLKGAKRGVSGGLFCRNKPLYGDKLLYRDRLFY
jgi:hypothetical protein